MEGWKEEVEGDHQVLDVRIWTDLVTVRINGRILFDRPKPTVDCRANGKRRSDTKRHFFHEVRQKNGV